MASTKERIETAVAALGDGALTEAAIAEHVAPLFSRVLSKQAGRSYLANHSLGRPLDAMEDDVREGLRAWYADLGGAWEAWANELGAFRARLARLIGASRHDCIVPKTSAGAGLRAVLGTFDAPPRVLSTRGEFDSLDVILREYARRGRIVLSMLESRSDGYFDIREIERAVDAGVDLIVLSQVMFRTGQLLPGLGALVHRAHATGAKVLLDVYHSLGAIPIDIDALGADFAVGGSYKYLRGGPGACFLYVAPSELDQGRGTLDIGWFAKEAPFSYARPDPPRWGHGGDRWLESTPPVLTWYQARSGQIFTLAIGVTRWRSWSLARQRLLVDLLAAKGISANGGNPEHGAFVVVVRDDAEALAVALKARGIDTDARGMHLRICPDLLTTTDELERVASTLSMLCAS